MIVLFDTNVLLDVLAQRDPFHVAASQVWGLAEHGLINGVVSATSINDVYYVARKHLGRDRALEGVRLITAVFEVAPIDRTCVDHALGSGMKDFEDGLQVAAAVTVRADFIVTRNVDDFSGAIIPAITPERLLAMIVNPPPPSPSQAP